MSSKLKWLEVGCGGLQVSEYVVGMELKQRRQGWIRAEGRMFGVAGNKACIHKFNELICCLLI